MNRIFILAFLSLLLITSCQKEKTADNSLPLVSLTPNDSKALESSTSNYFSNLKKAQNKLEIEKFIKEVKGKMNSGQGRPGLCPIMHDAKVYTQVTCGNSAGTGIVTFTWLVFEQLTYSGETLNYDFEVQTNSFLRTVTPTLVYESSPDCDPTGDVCIVTKQYEATITLTVNEIKNSYTSNVITTCSLSGSTPSTISTSSATFGFSQSDYLNEAARVAVSGSPLGMFVGTECSLVCYNYYVTCPTTVNFRYRLSSTAPSGIWTYPTIPPSGTILTVSPTGANYDWECTMTYPFGNSLLSSGTMFLP